MDTNNLERQIIRSLTRHFIGSPRRLLRLLNYTNEPANTWWKWRKLYRPNRTALTKMCRLVLWRAAQWPEELCPKWSAMRMEPVDLADRLRWDPFRLSKNVRFGYGGERDGGALIRDAQERLWIEHNAHLGRLLGCPEKKT